MPVHPWLSWQLALSYILENHTVGNPFEDKEGISSLMLLSPWRDALLLLQFQSLHQQFHYLQKQAKQI